MRYFALVCALFFGCSAHAGILNVDDTGTLTGVSGLDVEGTSYNVEFVDGTCTDLFGGCDTSRFAFSTEADALAASRTLFDNVLLAEPFVDVILTTGAVAVRGCGQVFACGILTPFGVQDDTVDVAFGTLLSGMDVAGNDAIGELQIDFDTSDPVVLTYARWTAVEAPAPAALPLLLVGLTFLVGFRRRSV